MSNSIATLLFRNLTDVFGENDPVRRRAAIDKIFHEDAVFYDPKGGVFRGRQSSLAAAAASLDEIRGFCDKRKTLWLQINIRNTKH